MLNCYYNHLVEDVKHHSGALLELCKASKDLKKTKRVCDLYRKYQADFSELAQFLSIHKGVSSDGSEAESLKEVVVAHQPCKEHSQHTGITSQTHAGGFNVDAPSFVPLKSIKINYDGSEICTPMEWIDNGEEGHTHLNIWHAPPVLHAQYPWPHHYHLPTHHHSSSVYPGFQASGVSIPMFTPYHYYAGNVPHHTTTMDNDELLCHRRQYNCNVKGKARDLKKSRAHATAASADKKTEKHFEPLHGLNVSKSSCRIQDIGTSQINLDTSASPKPEDAFSENCPESKLDVLSHSKKDDISEEKPVPDLPSLMDEIVYLPERLRDFPALSSNMPINKKLKVKLPRVKFQRKVKFTISDLYKTFNNTADINRKPRADKNLTSSYTFRSEKKPRASVCVEKTKCSCKNQVNLFSHTRTLYEKVPEDVLDEADGWKKVKPRFNKNRDSLKQIRIKENFIGVHPCKLCQSTYRRRYGSSNENKHVNIARNSHFTPKGYRSPRNNSTTEAIPSHVLDLHYKNMLVSPNISHRSGKINNEVNSTTSKNDQVSFADPEEVSDTSGVIDERDVLNVASDNQTPVPIPLDSYDVNAFNMDSPNLDIGVLDDSVGGARNLVLTPFSDDDFMLHNSCPTLSTTVSSGSIVDNEDECNTDNQNNMDFFGELSIDDDNTVNDSIPVVEDAQDMHEEFMKYLNCSTWPTQMDEIDKFESMIAGNNPSDPVLMYPSVSVEQFTEFILRHPSEAQAFRREITFKLRKIRETESKQQQAYEKRLELLKCKTDKVRGFVQKVKDVQLAQDRLALKRKHQIDEKLRKAEENRKNYLSIIRRKAHDEEEKLKEIAFINELEAQNRRHDSLALRQEHEERLQYLIDERHRRVEEKAAKEAAAEERRRIIEAERQQKLLKIAEARRIKEEEIDRKQQERENQRLETAREKAREREERLQARDAAQRATAEELQKRIQQKQEESARRHEENIESIRQRALEVGLHRNVDESINLSPVSKAEEPANIEFENSPDNPENVKQKALKKKRLRKIRVRLTTKGGDFINNFSFVHSKQFSFGKALADVQALGSHSPPGESVHKLAALRDCLLKSQKNEPATFSNFAKSKGFLRLSEILKGLVSTTGSLNSQDAQLISIIIDVYRVALVEGDSLSYIVLSNDIMLLVDILRFSVAGLGSNDKWIKVAETLLFTITSALDQQLEVGEDNKMVIGNLADICGYAINVGLVEKIVSVFQDVVIGTTCFIAIVPGCIKFFSAMLHTRYKSSDLMHTLISTECFGAIPLLYEGLQKIGGGDDLPAYVMPIVGLLLKFADLDVNIFQDALGGDGMALQIRAIASNLINYSKAKALNKLLQSVILLVGFFAMRNVKNQTLLQSGQQPTVLQQMVTLPIRYFCDQVYIDFLFPTLYVCSYNNPTNQAIVENDMSFSQLVDYVNSERGKKNLMMKLFHQMKQR